MNIVYVVADPNALNPGEVVIRDRLVATLGHVVTLVHHQDPAPSFVGISLVILSVSCNQNFIGTKYANIPCGVISMFVDPHPDMSESTYAVDASPVTTYYANAPGDVLLGGLTGTITMINSLSAPYLYYTQEFYGPGVINVMKNNSSSDRITLARAPQGAVLFGGTIAPTRRVFFGIPDAWPALFTADAWTIFGNAVTWASATPGQFPVANAGTNQQINAGDPVQLSGSGTDTDGTVTSYTWRLVSTTGPSVTLSSTSAPNPTFTAPNAGCTLVFGLVVTDNDGLQSPEDTVTVQVIARLSTIIVVNGAWVEKPMYIAKNNVWH
jgi:hypothetical protein